MPLSFPGTRDPRRTAPKAIVNALLVSFVGGGLMIIAALVSAPELGDDLAAGGMAWVIESQLDTWLGKTLLAPVAVAIFSATLAIHASASRVMFSMARDNRLPFGKFLSKVNKPARREKTKNRPKSLILRRFCVFSA